MNVKQKISYVLKILTVIAALGGLLLSFIEAQTEGFSHWSERLLYFTGQSNLWLGVLFAILLFLPYIHLAQWINRLYIFKYILTVSISMTGLVFCGLLGPFGPKSFHLWSFSSLLTHVFSPAFAIADFFVDPHPIPIQRKHIFYALLPAVFYFTITGIMGTFGVSFGRGQTFPYFFMNYRSPVGFFGFSNQYPYYMGTFYWMTFFGLIMTGIALLYARAKKPKHIQKTQ